MKQHGVIALALRKKIEEKPCDMCHKIMYFHVKKGRPGLCNKCWTRDGTPLENATVREIVIDQ